MAFEKLKEYYARWKGKLYDSVWDRSGKKQAEDEKTVKGPSEREILEGQDNNKHRVEPVSVDERYEPYGANSEHTEAGQDDYGIAPPGDSGGYVDSSVDKTSHEAGQDDYGIALPGKNGVDYNVDRHYVSPEEHMENGGFDIDPKISSTLGKIKDGIVPRDGKASEESLEMGREIFRSAKGNGELFGRYAAMRYEQIKDENTPEADKLRLFEELVIIGNNVDSFVALNNSDLSGGWNNVAPIKLKEGQTSFPELMQDLYTNRDKYGLPDYIKRPEPGSWGTLNPNSTEDKYVHIVDASPLIKGTAEDVNDSIKNRGKEQARYDEWLAKINPELEI